MFWIFWDNGKENGNYSILIGYALGLCLGYFGIMEKWKLLCRALGLGFGV